MTTTIAPDLKPDHSEREERPIVDRDPAHATLEELDTHFFDPTQGRKIGSDPYDNGLRVTDVWETKEQFEQYAQEKIAPYSQQVGIPGPPRITFYDVHNYQAATGE
jgi:hypothetical protein